MADEMRALTVKQPYAWAIACAGKGVENRTWGTAYYGLLAIHAAKAVHREGLDDPRIIQAIADRGFDIDKAASQQGAVVAVAVLFDCHPCPDDSGLSGCHTQELGYSLCSEWAQDGQFHWRLRAVRPLPQPVPCRGMLGLWRLPEDVEKAVRAQLEVADA
jgi:hypothetical protein